MSYYRNQLESWLKTITVDCNSVLDVGGGENPVKTRVKSFNAKKYKIMDNEAQFRPDLFGDINFLIDSTDEFDIVFCLEVFEYVWNPVQAIENLAYFLKDNGVAYISFPTIYPVHNPYGIDYSRYTKFGVEKLLGRVFKSWEITPRVATTGINYLRDFYSIEGMHPLKDRIVYDIGYLVKAIK